MARDGITLEASFGGPGLKLYGDKALDRIVIAAALKAGNDAIRTAQAAGKRGVRDKKRIRAAAVARGLPIVWPGNKTELHSLEWRLEAAGSPVRLAEVPHRQTRRGVVVEVNRGVRRLVRGAFIARMDTGHVGVFRRRGKTRLHIDEGFTTTIADVFTDSGFAPDIIRRGMDRGISTFGRVFELELDKAVKRGTFIDRLR